MGLYVRQKASNVSGPRLLLAIILLHPVLLTQLEAVGGAFFLPAKSYDSGGFWANAVATADLNRDGNADVVVANCGSSGSNGCPSGTSEQVGVLLGNGDGSFQPAIVYNAGGYGGKSIAVGDMNDDGQPDVVVANYCVSSNDCSIGSVGVLLGNGDGTFRPTTSYFSAVGPVSVAISDVDTDGAADLLVANSVAVSGGCFGGCIGVLLGNGDGTFRWPVTYSAGPQPSRFVAVADVNGDRQSDLLVASQCVSTNECPMTAGVEVLLGKGDGSFGIAVPYGSGGYDASSIAVADVNADGKPDLLVANVCADANCKGLVGVLLGNGDGTFRAPVTYDSGGYYANSIDVADLNGDRIPDLAVAHSCDSVPRLCPSGAVGVLIGNGDGTFGTPITYGSGALVAWGLTIGDVNGDGKPDVVTANETAGAYNGVVGVLLNASAFDTTPPVITLSATPTVLWPPNGRMIPITISGTMTEIGSGMDASSIAYTVTDEYGEVEPNGPITLDASGNYAFTFLLRAFRLDTDKSGRRYTVVIRASDNAGNLGSSVSVVTVPHDKGAL